MRLKGEQLVVESPDGGKTLARLVETSHLVLMGGAGCSTPALHECCRREIPILHLSGGGWFYGITRGLDHKNVELRSEQFAAARDSRRSLAVARALVAAKIRNARVLLRRNGAPAKNDLTLLAAYARRAGQAGDADELLGLEGSAAKLYYGAFSTMLKVAGGPSPPSTSRAATGVRRATRSTPSSPSPIACSPRTGWSRSPPSASTP